MATIDENLIRLNNVKTSWRQALASKGQEVSADAPMESYVVATGGIEPVLQDKSIEITENGTTTVSADTGYDGLNEVEITTNVAGGDETIIEENFVTPSVAFAEGTTAPNRFSWLVTSVKNLDTSGLTNMSHLFANCKNLTEIVGEIETKQSTSFYNMFSQCFSLLSIQEIDATNARSINNMFRNCYRLKNISFKNATNKLTDINYAFMSCSDLTSVSGLENARNNCSYRHVCLLQVVDYLPKFKYKRMR